ncbi:MAG: hypothetical protein NTZ78_02255 [Candidatus Aureabacteria bacterium]|nr:hypothetical protein [Candidatus Auribacterota bacterium]
MFGLGTSNGCNPAACLLVDGKLVAMVEEERLIRFKGACGQFPVRATKFCLQFAGIDLSDVDHIAFAWDGRKYPWKMMAFLARNWARYTRCGTRAADTDRDVYANLVLCSAEHLTHQIKDTLRAAGFMGRIPPIEFIPHHYAHAASAYYCSGFKRSAILIIDGSGEMDCTSSFVGDGTLITPHPNIRYKIPNSLGWFYAGMTEYLGFKPYNDEGKVMGLAPYGHHDGGIAQKISKILSFGNGTYSVDPSYLTLGRHTFGKYFSDSMVKLFGAARARESALEDVHKVIAYETQDALERCVTGIVDRLMEQTGMDALCLAGGVCMNCKMNGVLHDNPRVKNIFIQPVSSDSGTALGAALALSVRLGEDPRFNLDHAYWGPGYSNEEIVKILEEYKLPYKKVDNIEARVARFLAEGKFVGWFQGRLEMGARALGNRSILADPRTPGVKDTLNKQVKHREGFRPFAPSLLAEAKSEFLENASDSPFMILAYKVREDKKNLIPGVVHVDDTVRPHTVKKEVNPRYWRLIKEFEALTGVPVILNTSFNVRGEPIICSPGDAIRCFYGTGLDALAIGDYLLTKPGDM